MTVLASSCTCAPSFTAPTAPKSTLVKERFIARLIIIARKKPEVPSSAPAISSALPPRAITTRIVLASQRRYQDCFDGMQPVLCLIEDDGCLRLEYFVGDFKGFQAIFLVDFFP